MKYLEKIYGHGLVLQDRLLESYNKNKDKNYVLKLAMVSLILGAIGFNAYYSQKPYERIDYSNVEIKDLVFPKINYTNSLKDLNGMLELIKEELNKDDKKINIDFLSVLDKDCFNFLVKESKVCLAFDSNTKSIFTLTTLNANTNEVEKKDFYVINKFTKNDNGWDYIFLDGVINVDGKNDVLYTLDKTNEITKKFSGLSKEFTSKQKESVVLNSIFVEKLLFLKGEKK